MGKIRIYPPVKYIAAIAVADKTLWPHLEDKLVQLFSRLDHSLDWFPFTHTDYYSAEMGSVLWKRFVSFEQLDLAEKLPDFKLATNEIENGFSLQGKRRVNIDPGYLCAAKLVLASTKDFAHRIYLGRGVFGDLHLRFVHKHFEKNEWTYPDYQEPFVVRFFEEVRHTYLTQLPAFQQI